MSAAGFLRIAAGYGVAGVALGAFGAHGLRGRLSAAALGTWETAVFYHLIHTVALLGVAVLLQQSAGRAAAPLTVAGYGFAAGVLLFSGSLYWLALGGPGLLGPVTPLGGVALLVGWAALLWAAARLRA